jgi:cytochrome c biogenesis protein CcmG/thiol:disulfide interchange protein DsbE
MGIVPRPGRRRLVVVAGAALVALAVAAGILVAGGGTKASGAVVISGKDAITGDPVSTEKYKGYPLVLNIWASWCGPCNEEAADIRRFVDEHPNVRVVGIDLQDTHRGARGFYGKWQWAHPSIADPDGTRADKLGLPTVPTTYFTDAKHRIVGRLLGPGTLKQFNRELAKATKE